MSSYQDERIKEANRLRDLARYSEALALFEEAEVKHDDLSFALEISSLLLTMGLRGQACARVAYALDRFSSTEQDRLLVAHSKLFYSLNTILQTACASEPLKVAIQVYNEHLNAKPVEDYTQRMVQMEVSYSLLHGIVEFLGLPMHDAPTTSIQKVQDLFRYCTAQKWFGSAESMAGVYSSYYLTEEEYRASVSADARKSSLHDRLLLESSIPDLIRAKVLLKCSELLEDNGKTELAKERTAEAIGLFQKQKHAYGPMLIELKQLGSPSPTLSASQRITKIKEFQTMFEAVGNWADATMALQHRYKIAITELSDAKLGESIYEESLRIPGTAQGSIPWITWQLGVFRTLQWTGANTGRSLASIKALYTSLEDSEAPLLREKIAALLGEVYENLGNKTEAVKWISRVQHLGKYSTYQVEPFSQRLLTATSFLDLDEEMKLLTEAMLELAKQSSDNVPFSLRHVAPTKICNIADLYLNQVQLRVLPRLAVSGRQTCTGRMLQTKARLSLVEVMFAPPVAKVRQAMLNQALVPHEEALRHYQNADLPLLVGFASTQLAICHRTIWDGTNKADSRSFHTAAKLFGTASILLQDYASMDIYRKNAQLRLKLWFDGYKANVCTPSGILQPCATWLRWWMGMPVGSPLQRTKEYLEQLEQTIDGQRHDLSYLTSEQAVAAKQALRNNQDVQVLYEIAIPFYALQNDVDRVWRTVQKSKARSVSDLLGLGVVLPRDLAVRLEQDVEAKALLDRERQLFDTVENDWTDHQYFLRKTLDSHRDAMKKNAPLQELLKLREGDPITISRLRALCEILEAQGSKRRIVFADYFIVSGKISLLVVLSDCIQYFDLGVTVTQIKAWKEKHLQAYEPLGSEDDEKNLAALQELTTLVKPLEKISKEGDLIVLCASGPLHAVPLHAALLAQDSEKYLIDRNPVVYCPSMTVFEQCVMRAAAYTEIRKDTTGGQAMLAIYETPGELGWETERDGAYEAFSDLAEEIEDARIFTGAAVDDTRFREECGNARIVHFLGHCESGAGDAMQHLVFAAGKHAPADEQAATSQQASTNQTPMSSPERDGSDTHLPTKPFTISNLFSTSVHASHFNLVACGSASQVIGQGDEPWGVVTALLCAGATSVGGTMWPIQVGTGEVFMKMLYQAGIKSDGGEGGIIDLAVAHQKVVRKLKRWPDTVEPYHWAAFVLHGAWFYRR